MTTQELALRLDRDAKQTSKTQWQAHCPGPSHAHADRHASLSISAGADGKTVLMCHAGCAITDVLAAKGLTLADCFADAPIGAGRLRPPPRVTRYAMRNLITGEPFTHIRKDYLDADGTPYRKKYMCWEPAGAKTPEMPLWLVETVLAAPADAVVYLCEGEETANALARLGVLAVGTVCGAGSMPIAEALRPLVGHPVRLWPDNDAPGESHMQKIAARLVTLGIPSPSWVRWPDAPEAGDAADFFAAGGTVAQLDALVKERPARASGQREGDAGWQPTVQSAHDLLLKVLPPVRWAVEGLLPEGVNLLAAKAKKGKSTLMLHLACAIADGVKAMGYFATTRCEVLYLDLEGNERRSQKRLRQVLQGEPAPKGLHVSHDWLPLDMGGDKALETYLDAYPAIKVVVIDTLEHIRAKRRSPTGSYADDYAAVRWLQQMAGRRQLCVVVIHHTRKAPAEDPFDEINATMGLLASVDNALVMRPNAGIMELHRRGRDYEDDTVLALKGDANTLLWRVEGNAEEVTRSAERRGILDALAAAVPDTMSSQELATVTKWRDGNVRFLLSKMLADGEVIRPERGQYTIPTNNANNANNRNGKSGGERDKPIVSDVSDSESPTNIANNDAAPLWAWADARDVSDVSESRQNGHAPGPVCLKCRAPKVLNAEGGYTFTCTCDKTEVH